MDIFNLSATIGIDISNYKSGINTATSMYNDLSSLISKGLKLTINTIWNFGKDVIKTGMAFDEQMSAVQAVLGSTEGTVKNITRLRQFALDIAIDSVFTAEETAQAYYYMGMAGWKTEQMISGLPAVLALAAASGEDLGIVSDIVTDSLTAFGLTADDASYYADILAQTATNANTNVFKMGSTFRYVAPIAGQLGLGVDDVALSIGLLANSGIKAGQAGTVLRNIFTRLSTNAGATSKQMGALEILTDELGVSVYDANGKWRDWSDILNETRAVWGHLSQEEQVYYAKQIATIRGMSGWMVLMNASEDEINQLSLALSNAGGAAENMANVRLDNLLGDTIKFNSALDIMKIAIYDDVKGPMREIVQDGTASIKRITTAIDENGLTGGITQLGVEIEAAGQKLSPVLEGIGKAMVPIFEAGITALGPTLIETAVSLGEALGAGLLQGLSEALTNSNVPMFQTVGKWLSSLLPDPNDPSSNWSVLRNGVTNMPVGGNATTPEQMGIHKLTDDEYNDWVESKNQGSEEETVVEESTQITYASAPPLSSTWSTKHTLSDQPIPVDGGYIVGDRYVPVEEYTGSKFGGGRAGGGGDFAPDAGRGRKKSTVDYGVDSDTSVGVLSEEAMASAKQSIAAAISEGAEEGASSIPTSIASQTDSVLGIINGWFREHTIDVKLNITSVAGAGITAGMLSAINFHASAMEHGEILEGVTPFGIGRNGTVHVGGEVGREAVVGVDSLDDMIQKSVNTAMDARGGTSIEGLVEDSVNRGMAEIKDTLNSILYAIRHQDTKIVMNSGALVGQISREMDKQLGTVAKWRGGGRT